MLLWNRIIKVGLNRNVKFCFSGDSGDFYNYCKARNYPIEDHTITTDDHYNLKFYRIQKKGTKIQPLNKVVYLQHGLADSSDTWIRNEERVAPGFMLAEKGYDVWIGNTRGNTYSTRQLSPNVKDYWNFSFSEMADHDLPAAFSYIKAKTNNKINYIGHSQGTLIMFIALSQKNSTVSQNLASFCALGPVAYLSNVRSEIVRKMFNYLTMFGLNYLQIPQPLLGRNETIESFMRKYPQFIQFLNIDKNTTDVANFLTENISDEHHRKINNIAYMPEYLTRYPAGSSRKNFLHFGQYITNGGYFAKYNYGINNFHHYKKFATPLYQLDKITAPLTLFVGKYDMLATVNDVKRLSAELVNSKHETKHYDYGHISFLMSKNSEYINDVVKVIEKAGN